MPDLTPLIEFLFKLAGASTVALIFLVVSALACLTPWIEAGLWMAVVGAGTFIITWLLLARGNL